jgi:hypothetical protein
MFDILRYVLTFIVPNTFFYNCWYNLVEIYDFSCETEYYVIDNNAMEIRFLLKKKNERASLPCVRQHFNVGEVFK